MFSILIANYNNGRYLEECLNSIFSQTYQNWEIVIVDDGSTDNSHIIYQKYAADPRLRIIKNNKNKGCGYTKRKCIANARGDICGFVDPDDAIEPEAIEIMVEEHANKPYHSMIYSTHYICDDHLCIQEIADYVDQIPENEFSWEKKKPIISHFATFKINSYSKSKGISPFLQKAVDKDLYYKLESVGPVFFINQPLYYYRQHPKSISLNQNASLAYQYHLCIKATIAINSNERIKILKRMPHKKSQLAKALLLIGFSIILTRFAFYGLSLLMKSVIYFPIESISGLPVVFYRIVLK